MQITRLISPSVAIWFALLILPRSARACGPWLPERLLSQGGSSIEEAPEFFFELETKELAKKYPVPFQTVRPPSEPNVEDHTQTDTLYSKQTAEADENDFSAAIKAGEIKPPDVEKAKAQHRAARVYIGGTAGQSSEPTEEFSSEFSLYHRGAVYYSAQDYGGARQVWKELLTLPPEQRQYRSTWATFMLGKTDLAEKKYDDAKQWFRQTRELVASKFVDSVGLAAASLGWEGYAALEQKSLSESAKLYLQALATGDVTSVMSLEVVAGKIVGPEKDFEWTPAKAGANGNVTPTPSPTPNTNTEFPEARDPVLRPVISAYILAGLMSEYNPGPVKKDEQIEKWLQAIEHLHLSHVECADVLGWIEYGNGHYAAAQRWLNLADPDSAMSLWLKAKLDFRAGKTGDAIKALSRAVHLSPKISGLESREIDSNVEKISRPSGDLGLLLLSRGEFQDAFHQFLDNDNWQDAAYVAERVLALDELKALVDKEYPLENKVSATDDEIMTPQMEEEKARADRANRMRWLLGRRLVRAERYQEALAYLPAEQRTFLDQYVASVKTAQNKATSPKDKANALWSAAQVMREHGMELRGTENEPDFAIWDGSFQSEDIAGERLRGYYSDQNALEDNTGETKTTSKLPLVIAATAREQQQLRQNKVVPDKRFHYRYVAADLAWSAARLMPDNSDETALILATAGTWLKKWDDTAANRFYEALVNRCEKTALGQEAKKTRWFPELPDASPSPSPDNQ
jgi:hypothetical protein